MLTTDFEEQEGITVPYPSLFDNIRNNYGFVDLRGRPDLVAEIKEGIQSNALRSILTELAKKDSPFFTLGCDLGAHEEQHSDPGSKYVAGGYLQVMDRDYSERSPNDYLNLAYVIAHESEKDAQAHNWTVRFIHTSVQFNLDNFGNIAPSLWIWFYAAATAPAIALESREALIGRLEEILIRVGG